MAKRQFKPGNMLYPVPAVLVSVADREGKSNLFTVAWAGTVCTNPPMLSISVRPERYSYHMIKETGEFVVNLTTKDLVFATFIIISVILSILTWSVKIMWMCIFVFAVLTFFKIKSKKFSKWIETTVFKKDKNNG